MAYLVQIDPVVIDAPVEQVWQVLTDFEKYPDWNPFTPRIVGSPEMGARITLHVRMGGRHTRIQPEKITHLSPGRSFAWGPLYPGWFLKGRRWQEVEAINPHQTVYRTWESFSGLMAPWVVYRYKMLIKRGFEAMSLALQKRFLPTNA